MASKRSLSRGLIPGWSSRCLVLATKPQLAKRRFACLLVGFRNSPLLGASFGGRGCRRAAGWYGRMAGWCGRAAGWCRRAAGWYGRTAGWCGRMAGWCRRAVGWCRRVAGWCGRADAEGCEGAFGGMKAHLLRCDFEVSKPLRFRPRVPANSMHLECILMSARCLLPARGCRSSGRRLSSTMSAASFTCTFTASSNTRRPRPRPPGDRKSVCPKFLYTNGRSPLSVVMTSLKRMPISHS